MNMEGRVLKPVPAELRIKMDALVHDLTQALEETSCSSSVRIKMGFRRRARSSSSSSRAIERRERLPPPTSPSRSTGNLGLITQRTTHSDDSISERIHCHGKDFSSLQQSDSDEVSANSQKRLIPYPLQKRTTNFHQNQNFESDSVNENFSPMHTGTRRKRKMKKMDVDGAEASLPAPKGPPASCFVSKSCLPIPGPSGVKNNIAKKKKVLKNPDVNNTPKFDTFIGKRKRSTRERSSDLEMDGTISKASRLSQDHRREMLLADGEAMELDRELMSSSSLSSSESDAGIYTNDEGREGDDEQSDWFGEARWDEDTDLEQEDPNIQTILNGCLDNMSADARQAYKERIDWLREGFMDREIRGGRRRVRSERPGFTVLTSANEKLSRFLQDCDQLTLKLHPMDVAEREQLTYLVNLYSLHMRIEATGNGQLCPVLSKTSSTPQVVRIDQATLSISDFKKRRKTPQSAQSGDVAGNSMNQEDIDQLMTGLGDP